MIPVTANNDAELVGASLAGNRDAFGLIVSRYQSLVCSLAFSATGSLSQSEDLAQETFVAAWKQLAGLREPEKLRSWLCGIARNLINNFLRCQGREPSHRAESLDEISESPSPEPLPHDHTISNEEQAILWRSLERIPEIYREPLVLFYREHQSVEAVAEKLELTEDNVKQRLSRGRKLLQEEVLAFVEGALARTNPGQAFTLGVLAALPMVSTSAKATGVGTTLVKASTIPKIGTFFASGGGFLPVLGSLFFLYKNVRQQQIENDLNVGSEPMTREKRKEILAKIRRHGSKARVYLYLGLACNMGGLAIIQLVHAWNGDQRHLYFFGIFIGIYFVSIHSSLALSSTLIFSASSSAGYVQISASVG
jgi:RNA polymerase sigma factor (sigma-70 family)